MKVLVVLLTTLISMSAFSSGKIMVQPQYFVAAKKVTPMVGIAIYEKFASIPAAYNGWAGLGDVVFADQNTTRWYSVRHAIDLYTKSPLVWSPGVQSVKAEGQADWDHRVFVRATYQIW
jgi:hypothetical protein